MCVLHVPQHRVRAREDSLQIPRAAFGYLWECRVGAYTAIQEVLNEIQGESTEMHASAYLSSWIQTPNVHSILIHSDTDYRAVYTD